MAVDTIYLDTWKRFVKEGVMDSTRLNNRIIESWHRCKKNDVNPYLNKGLHILSDYQFALQKEKNSLLLKLVSPHLADINQMLVASGMMGLLIDPDGYVLSVTGNEKTVHYAQSINFVEGVRWTECEVGTNAIGTSLAAREPVIINGAEHYSVASHTWSCAAAPIFNANGNLFGILDVSCPVEQSHPFMLGIVTSIAYAIESELGKYTYQQEVSLLQQAIELAEIHPNRHFIVCNLEERIIFSNKLVREKIQQSVDMNLQDFLLSGFRINQEIPIRSKPSKHLIGTGFILSDSFSGYKKLAGFTPSSFMFKGEMGTSKTFQYTLKKAQLVAPKDTTVFITGETGTGKELIAQAIHDNSPRKEGPFISVNCGAIPKDLMESELFGYVAGSFTGAKRNGYKGKFEQANGGTLFLDEIGEIPPSMQIALLRVLQERKVVPIGGYKEIPLDIRIIAATHRDLAELVAEGSFRQDLFYRLNVYPIDVPSLRDRREDISNLVCFICEKNSWDIPITDKLLMKLTNYEWPGNIRELHNFLERLHILASDGSFDSDEILPLLPPLHSPALTGRREEEKKTAGNMTAREKIQHDLMLDALQKTKGNVTAAAKLLDIPRSTFYKRLQRFGI
ncbi:sigma-54-dependent Fis family transcriptional regulator [Mesobacillus maritimus]|uniref:sigma-54-dependent Fis family transcriptional regulator n=1 Tax=Mesobacillus maritimus TaxID=1643336 RepID=UPI00384B412B